MKRLMIACVILLAACLPLGAPSSLTATVAGALPKGKIPLPAPASTNPDFIAAEILGRPTDTSVTVNVVPAVPMEIYYEYGTAPGAYTAQTISQTAAAGTPLETLISGLQPDTRYYYRLRRGDAAGQERTFVTQRAPGSTFTFTIDADPHNRDPNFNGDLFSLTLQNALNDHPDFLIDLGDTFMTEKVRATTYLSVVQTMLDMRPYFGLLGQSAPLFLVNGNHEGELGWLRDGASDNLAIWSTQARQLYYPNPIPGDFYGGSVTPEPIIGVRDGYYAWEWGDALFVVLDPFWYTTDKPRPGDDGWAWTLGQAQYDWFKQTLEDSQAKFKFVFAHQLVGGTNDQYGVGRGGIEWAGKYEWGGYNLDGSWGFDVHRPGWEQTIHQLLVNNHVSIFFHGHDHLFVKQVLDGVVYQEVPQPSNRSYDNITSAADYGYVNGDIAGNSGYLRVSVSPAEVTVDYVRAYLPQDETAQRVNGAVSYRYTLRNEQAARVYLPAVMHFVTE